MKFVRGPKTGDDDLMNILFDPQTSGGLLAAVEASDAEKALAALITPGIRAAVIGETVAGVGMIELT